MLWYNKNGGFRTLSHALAGSAYAGCDVVFSGCLKYDFGFNKTVERKF